MQFVKTDLESAYCMSVMICFLQICLYVTVRTQHICVENGDLDGKHKVNYCRVFNGVRVSLFDRIDSDEVYSRNLECWCVVLLLGVQRTH